MTKDDNTKPQATPEVKFFTEHETLRVSSDGETVKILFDNGQSWEMTAFALKQFMERVSDKDRANLGLPARTS